MAATPAECQVVFYYQLSNDIVHSICYKTVFLYLRLTFTDNWSRTQEGISQFSNFCCIPYYQLLNFFVFDRLGYTLIRIIAFKLLYGWLSKDRQAQWMNAIKTIVILVLSMHSWPTSEPEDAFSTSNIVLKIQF